METRPPAAAWMKRQARNPVRRGTVSPGKESGMKQKLGILVTSDRHLDHLIGVCRAAAAAGKEVSVFLTNRGVLMTQAPAFKELDGQAHISLCNVNFEYFKLTKPVPLVADKDFATQMRHAEMIEDCDRYLVI